MKADQGIACLSLNQMLWARTLLYFELTKPRLTLLALFTTLIGMHAGARVPIHFQLFFSTAVGTALIAGGAAAFNMFAERKRDFLMQRTALRPLAAGKLRAGNGFLFALALSVAGFASLFLMVNPLSGCIAAIIVAAYLFLYTPLKSKTWLCTIIGAIPGALPIVMGWTAVNGKTSLGAWILFSIVFLWQLPHFYAIAWMHRQDYARAGFSILSVIDKRGKRIGRHAIASIALLLVISVSSSFIGMTSSIGMIGAAFLGALFLKYGIRFARKPDYASAKQLFIYSAFYLPALLLILAFTKRY
jgi:protoheme IX farnesyltransferase